MNFGLIIEPPKETVYIFGARQLGDTPLQPDGNWSGYLPDIELQNNNGVETYSCVTQTTNNCIEILERKLYGARTNWSDRLLAKQSGTKEKQGNTPDNVAETRRKKGCVEEYEWPFDSSINTYEKFYADIPRQIETLALGRGAEQAFGYEIVRSNANDLMNALQYSPLGFSTYAWTKDENGLHYRPQGETDNHFVTVYGYEKDKFWLAFDSYTTDGIITLKKIRWDTIPMSAMRYTLTKQVVVPSAWNKFLVWLRKAIYGLAS